MKTPPHFPLSPLDSVPSPRVMLKCEQLAEREATEVDTYYQRGGLLWAWSFFWWSNATWPFANLQATPQTLEISVGIGPISRTFALNRSDVERISIKRGLFCKGLKVTHSRPDYPPLIVFWTFQPRRLLSEMAKLGYPFTS